VQLPAACTLGMIGALVKFVEMQGRRYPASSALLTSTPSPCRRIRNRSRPRRAMYRLALNPWWQVDLEFIIFGGKSSGSGATAELGWTSTASARTGLGRAHGRSSQAEVASGVRMA